MGRKSKSKERGLCKDLCVQTEDGVLEEIEGDQCLLNWSRVGKIRVLCVRHPNPAVGLSGRSYPSSLRPLNNKK